MTRPSHAAALALCLVSVAASCATSGDTASDPGGEDASTDVHEHRDTGGGPSPDAIVPTEDARSDGANNDATLDAPVENKSCLGLPDGTPCAPAPDVCHDPGLCKSGACAAPAAKADGFACGTAPDACHLDPVCKSGVCGTAAEAPDGTKCGNAPDPCHLAPVCKTGACEAAAKAANGTKWSSAATDICCDGVEAHSSDNDNCGICGIKCNASNGESCQILGGHYFCRGCIASGPGGCWSGCCSTSFSPFSCAASDCNGNCCATCCPAGTHCVVGGTTSSDYCSY